jgi:SAM-dependent methyltransferase
MTFMRPKLDAPDLVTEYSKVIDPVYLENLPARFATFRRTLERIRPYFAEGARVLEVGSYCGAFLKVAREQGLDVLGLEPSAWAVEQSARLTSAPVIRGTLDDLPADIGRFDCVVAWDVLEHFADPVDELIRVNRALNMGGRFFFCTVMVDNWFPRLVGRYWPWFMDMHLFYFTDETLRHVLDRAGFSLVESTPYRHITNAKYLLRKLGTIGVPGASLASRLVSSTPWGMTQIPVSLGDIQLFVCTKVREPSELDSSVQLAAPLGADDDDEARPGLPN